VIANNPIRKGGCLDSLSAEKAARFVRMCDSLGIPLLVVADVPGYLPGVRQEWDGVVRRGASCCMRSPRRFRSSVTWLVWVWFRDNREVHKVWQEGKDGR
jgi:hypothetical protein